MAVVARLPALQFVVRRDGGGGGAVRGMNWVFNSWGEKNATWELDVGVAAAVLEHAGVERVDNPFVLEGGSIHVDGEGCAPMLATSCRER